MEEKGKFMKTFLAQFGLMIIPISQTPYCDIVDTDGEHGHGGHGHGRHGHGRHGHGRLGQGWIFF